MPSYSFWAAALAACLLATPARAQTVTANVELLFYGDNTEFANPFREGETLLGTAGRLYFDVVLNDTVTLRGGFFGNGRYGSHRFLEHAEPMLAIEFARGPSRFVFGSLHTATTNTRFRGPDEETPHGLLPPIHRETLTFTRPHEMGLQWLVNGARVTQDAWIEWQRLNTAEHRERFDAGYKARLPLSRAIALHGQWHLVHEGGQQFANGTVRDSQAVSLGVETATRTAKRAFTADVHAVLTREVPDRERAETGQTGLGVFGRLAIERGSWRAHGIAWRSRDTLKEEGDPNYLMLRRDGRWFRKVRDYAEIGLTRNFAPAPGVQLAASVRLHRVESHYEYSYRIVSRVRLSRGL
jgi:hypothetical protein